MDTGGDCALAGGLGAALEANNYFVSDTYYGWGGGIGSSTDTTDWPSWFNISNLTNYNAVLAESGQNSTYYNFHRTRANPGGNNTVILFKSCYPLSEVGDSITD